MTTICPPGTVRTHWDRISTFQHTRVEVELEVEVEVGLRVGLESSWAVGVEFGLRLGGWGRVGVALGSRWGRVGVSLMSYYFVATLKVSFVVLCARDLTFFQLRTIEGYSQHSGPSNALPSPHPKKSSRINGDNLLVTICCYGQVLNICQQRRR